MSSVKKLVSNTLSMFIAQGLQPFLTIVLVFIIGRTLGPEIFGKYNLIFQMFSIFQVTCSMGLKTLLTREVATQKDRVNKFLVNGVLLGIPSSLLNILVVFIAVYFLNYTADVNRGIYYIAISLLAMSLTDILSGVLTGLEEVKQIAYAWIAFLVVKTGLSIIALLLGYGLFALVWIHVFAKFMQTVIVYLYVYKILGRPHFEFDWKLSKKLIRMGWSMALLGIIVSLFWRIDTMILGKMVTEEQVGFHGAAYRIFHFMLMTVRSFSMAFLPVVSTMYAENLKNFRNACRKAIRYLTITVLPIMLFTTLLAPYVMPILWGSKYDNALVSQVLIWMAWSLLPFAITEVFASAMIAANQEVLYFIQKGIALAVKFGLTYYLTLKYGIVGPAIATLAALVILLLGQLPFIIPKLISLDFKAVAFPFFKLLLVVVFTAVAFYALADFQVILATGVSVAVFGGSFWLLKIAADQDLVYFKKMLKRKSRAKH